MDSCKTWNILTQFYFDLGLGGHKRIERLLPAAAEAGAPMQIRVLYLPAGGSPILTRAELSRLARDMERYFPHCQTTVVLGEMPFEEEVSSFGSYFDRATFSTKNEGEKRKRIKRDLLTSVATTLRSIERQKPTIIVGDGPGALVALGLSKPEFLEYV